MEFIIIENIVIAINAIKIISIQYYIIIYSSVIRIWLLICYFIFKRKQNYLKFYFILYKPWHLSLRPLADKKKKTFTNYTKTKNIIYRDDY